MQALGFISNRGGQRFQPTSSQNVQETKFVQPMSQVENISNENNENNEFSTNSKTSTDWELSKEEELDDEFHSSASRSSSSSHHDNEQEINAFTNNRPNEQEVDFFKPAVITIPMPNRIKNRPVEKTQKPSVHETLKLIYGHDEQDLDPEDTTNIDIDSVPNHQQTIQNKTDLANVPNQVQLSGKQNTNSCQHSHNTIYMRAYTDSGLVWNKCARLISLSQSVDIRKSPTIDRPIFVEKGIFGTVIVHLAWFSVLPDSNFGQNQESSLYEGTGPSGQATIHINLSTLYSLQSQKFTGTGPSCQIHLVNGKSQDQFFTLYNKHNIHSILHDCLYFSCRLVNNLESVGISSRSENDTLADFNQLSFLQFFVSIMPKDVYECLINLESLRSSSSNNLDLLTGNVNQEKAQDEKLPKCLPSSLYRILWSAKVETNLFYP